MSNDLLCTWLGLPLGCWPPDHYRLLGLEPGEDDVGLIEQRVHQRLDSVRRYQMMHPEQATEAMNRLAQAFVCLTEPSAKRVYDAELLGPKATPPRIPPPNKPRSDPQVPALGTVPPPLPPFRAPPPLPVARPREMPPPGDRGGVSPPVPALTVDEPPARRQEVEETVTVAEAAKAAAAAAPLPRPAQRPFEQQTGADLDADTHPDLTGNAGSAPSEDKESIDEVVLLARSPLARRGLGTRRSLLRRRALTHRLLRLWGEAEHYFQDPRHRASRQEAVRLFRLVHEISETLEDFPPLLGKAGQAGYMLLVLTQRETARDIQKLDAHQRESLQRDCQAGLKLLRAHRDFLREELRAVRRRSRRERWIRAVRGFLNDRPALAILTLLGLLALVLALGRTLE